MVAEKHVARAREWLREHCTPEPFVIFGDTWTEPLAKVFDEIERESAKELMNEIARLKEIINPCKGGCFRLATHAKKNVIFGIGRAELCKVCVAKQSKEDGCEWVRLDEQD